MASKTGIAIKFIGIVTLVTLIVMSALAGVIITNAARSQETLADTFVSALRSEQKHQEEALIQQLTLKADSLADLMTLTARGFIQEFDFDSLQTLADNGAKDNDIAAIVFYAPDGSAMTKEHKAKGANIKKIRKEITADGEIIGTIEVHLKLDSARSQSQAVGARISTLVAAANRTMAATSKQLEITIAIGTLIAIAAQCLGIFFCLRFFVITPVERAANALDNAAVEVTNAANELTEASMRQAEGASQQAAALEETSSSLEEVAAMTMTNADNARQCNDLMQEMKDVVARASTSMTEQKTAMVEIKNANEATSKIIKTIDEIAFQTNLLALNAAVEAARAGEAGAGFAVVADEVRNLAQRSAEAANETKNLIEKTIDRVNEGSALSVRAEKDFSAISTYTDKVGTMLAEISNASNEQTTGISQVNKAVAEIDKVTQATAASSEESASSAEELRAQADRIKTHIDDLIALIKGGSPAPQTATPTGDDTIPALPEA